MRSKNYPCKSSAGYSTIEIIVVVGVIAVATAMAIPQMISQRRLMTAHNMVNVIATRMRDTRQQAMSQRQAFTITYDDTAKQLLIIDNNTRDRATLLNDALYPLTTTSTVSATIPLNVGGLDAAEISYGIPSALPVGASSALADGISKSNLTSSKLNITFEPDGTVTDASGNPANFAMYIYDNRAPAATASAISVLGASGRVKIWRYSPSASQYVE